MLCLHFAINLIALKTLFYPTILASMLIHHLNELTSYTRWIFISNNFYNKNHKL